ncbi:FGGY-family carbohydrate kinase [candidate division KSB1 bacterium]|nr:FGGY-family carbohydrate kinase [candidate division KSB1 bacterium]
MQIRRKQSGEKYILTYDIGTSSNKAVLFTEFGKLIGMAKEEYSLSYPRPNHVEQDPFDWVNAIYHTTRKLLKESRINPRNIVALTFACQMQTTVAVDRDGNPLMPAISWLDTRAEEIMRRFWRPPRIKGYNIFYLLRFLSITGGSPGHTGKDPIGKIIWLKHHHPDLFSKIYKFLDAKDFVIYHLTGQFVKSVDMAVVWWLLDTRKNRNQWHPGLCRLAGIEPEHLPEVKESAAIVGHLSSNAASRMGLSAGIPVINGAGDISSSALGSGAIGEGELNIRLGTSGGVSGHFTRRKIDLTHYAGCIGSTFPKKYYLALAHQETVGICLEWLKNKILYHEKQLTSESHVEDVFQIFDQMAETTPPGSGGLIFTPWMYGERCPLDDHFVRAGLFNVSLHHNREHIIRAIFEGIAFNIRWAMETVENLYQPVQQLNIIGGGAKSEIWCQIIADITNRQINQVANPQEANARGVALLASYGLGFISNFEDIKNYIHIKKRFSPNFQNRELYDRLFAEFKNIYKQNKNWYKRLNR